MWRCGFAAIGAFALSSFGQSTVLYKTSFEKTEGFDNAYTLGGQLKWRGDGSGGNGLLEATLRTAVAGKRQTSKED